MKGSLKGRTYTVRYCGLTVTAYAAGGLVGLKLAKEHVKVIKC